MHGAALLVVVATACGGGGAVDAGDRPFPDARPRSDAAVSDCTPVQGTTPVFRQVMTVKDVPVLITSPPGGDPRAFLVERYGWIWIIEDEARLPTPFIDLTEDAGGPVYALDEQGLLGLAFHPQYASNGRFFVYYTTRDANVVAEYHVSPDAPDRGDPASGEVLLSIPDFAGNHNGGMIEFGPDGNLYIGTGDGGGGGDPEETGQDPDRLLGKMLRIDVDHPEAGRPYGIPLGNPFAHGGGAPEVFATGLRNPWRWSFDPSTHDLYIGDVGQGAVEEIDVVPLAHAAGVDFGWDDCEGTHDYEGTGCANPTDPDRIRPVFEQVRQLGGGTSEFGSIVGGQVYRGSCFPALVGRYFFTDYIAGGLWSFRYEDGIAVDVVEHEGDFPLNVTSIHGDGFGELWVTHVYGNVYRLEAE